MKPITTGFVSIFYFQKCQRWDYTHFLNFVKYFAVIHLIIFIEKGFTSCHFKVFSFFP